MATRQATNTGLARRLIGSSARGAWFDHGLDHGMANAEAHYRSVVNKPAHGTSARWHAGCHCVYAGYRLFLIFAASSV